MGNNDDPRPPRARLLKRDGELGELFPILGDRNEFTAQNAL
jgi:hypothetical protein